MSRVTVDIFNDSCSENAVTECKELEPWSPSEFDAEEFDEFCRYFLMSFEHEMA